MAIKRRKSKHKTRIRPSIRNTLFIVFGILIALSIYKVLTNTIFTPKEQKENIVYKSKEDFKQDYSVTIKKNKYMDIEDMKNEKIYVTEFLEKINTNYKFKYEGEKAEKINLIYKVRGELKGNYLSEGKEEEFWNREYVLIDEKMKSSENNVIEVDEELEIDIKQFNKLIKDFIEEIQISIDAKLCVIFEANVTAYSNGEMILDSYTNEMDISLGQKTTKITGKFDDEKENTKTKKVEIAKETNALELIGWIILGLACTYAVLKIKRNTKTTNRVTNAFKIELNQILNACGDKIIKIDSNNSIYGNNIIEVSDINEIVKLSEEAFKPILYYQVPNTNVAWFYVVLEKEIYRYILK